MVIVLGSGTDDGSTMPWIVRVTGSRNRWHPLELLLSTAKLKTSVNIPGRSVSKKISQPPWLTLPSKLLTEQPVKRKPEPETTVAVEDKRSVNPCSASGRLLRIASSASSVPLPKATPPKSRSKLRLNVPSPPSFSSASAA